MAKIAFILLCHKDPTAIIEQAERLTTPGDYVAIHFDGRADAADYAKISAALSDNPNVVFADRRIKCGWGEWSLVEASLEAIRAAEAQFPEATHFYMLSGDCMPIKSAAFAYDLLEEQSFDFVESFDYFTSDWIKTGMQEDRLIYRHWFNERKNKRLFYTSYEWQKSLGLKRDVPADLQMMIGSQWWCLRRGTIERILDFVAQRPEIVRFFRTTWIPDETFFQTLVRHLVPDKEIQSRTLTFLMFSDYGMPVTFHNDHFDLLVSQNYLFARKISADAEELKSQLGSLWASERMDFEISDEGRELFKFLTYQGRIGRRFTDNFWEKQASLGPERSVFVVVCKKWHVAKNLKDLISDQTDLICLGYIFEEESSDLPWLGGIGEDREKRTRHRRAFMRMLYAHFDASQMLICLDPSSLGLLQDLNSDSVRLRVLEIACDFSDDYLVGHARRVGLAGPKTPRTTIDRLLPTIRQNFAFEIDQLRKADLNNYFAINERQTRAERIEALSRFLGVAPEAAAPILCEDNLFED